MNPRNETTLKVVYFNHTSDISGAEMSLLLTISHMKGIDAVLVAPEGPLLERARELGLQVQVTSGFRARMSKNPIVLVYGLYGTLTVGLKLRKLIGTLEPNIVHANSIRAGLICLVAVFVRRQTRLVWHVRDNLSQNLIGSLIRRVTAKCVDHVVAISNAVYNNFSTTPELRRKSSIVYNGVDTDNVQGVSIRQALGVNQEKFIVGVVGQIAPWKRQHDAIEAFSNFVRHATNTELWIVGEPKFRVENIHYFERLRERTRELCIENQVRFLGFRNDIVNVMSSIDVLLIPSENEPFGRVVIEAMLAGRPVIGTRGGGIPEIVTPGSTGYLTEVGDIDAMKRYLVELHSDLGMREVLGTGGRLRVLDQFSIRSTADQISQLYASMTHGTLPSLPMTTSTTREANI